MKENNFLRCQNDDSKSFVLNLEVRIKFIGASTENLDRLKPSSRSIQLKNYYQESLLMKKTHLIIIEKNLKFVWETQHFRPKPKNSKLE